MIVAGDRGASSAFSPTSAARLLVRVFLIVGKADFLVRVIGFFGLPLVFFMGAGSVSIVGLVIVASSGFNPKAASFFTSSISSAVVMVCSGGGSDFIPKNDNLDFTFTLLINWKKREKLFVRID
jgi:hypothetical protein